MKYPHMSDNKYSTWKIQKIRHTDALKPMKPNKGALIGAFVLVSSIAIYITTDQRYAYLLVVSFLALLLVGFSIYTAGRSKRRSWLLVSATCLEHETKRVLSTTGGGYVWAIRLLCEYEVNNEQHRVTPDHWTTFHTESRAQDFISSQLQYNARCKLYVNPENPLQAELATGDIKDKLLHKKLSS